MSEPSEANWPARAFDLLIYSIWEFCTMAFQGRRGT